MIRLLFTGGALFGVFLVVAIAMQMPVVAQAMGSPAACATCHLVAPEVQSLAQSAHMDLSCLDCHSARNFWHRPIDEAKSAGIHLWVPLTASEPDCPC